MDPDPKKEKNFNITIFYKSFKFEIKSIKSLKIVKQPFGMCCKRKVEAKLGFLHYRFKK
jgi:hypothetical protein